MFATHIIKELRRGIKRRQPPDYSDLFIERADERTLPYFSIVPEQVLADDRYAGLDSMQRGLFWLLVIHFLWKGGGMCIRHHGVIAKELRVDVETWENLETHLLKIGLLHATEDAFHLVQLELRTQYLMTLEVNNSRRRKEL